MVPSERRKALIYICYHGVCDKVAVQGEVSPFITPLPPQGTVDIRGHVPYPKGIALPVITKYPVIRVSEDEAPVRMALPCTSLSQCSDVLP